MVLKLVKPDSSDGALEFRTGWFVESLLTQTLIVHIIRTNKIPFIQSRPSLPLFLGTLTVMAIGAYLPFSVFAPSPARNAVGPP